MVEPLEALGAAATVGLLGTSATLRCGLYQRRPGPQRRWLVPDATEMNTLVTPGIAAVKAGDLVAEIDPRTQQNTLLDAEAQLAAYQAHDEIGKLQYRLYWYAALQRDVLGVR